MLFEMRESIVNSPLLPLEHSISHDLFCARGSSSPTFSCRTQQFHGPSHNCLGQVLCNVDLSVSGEKTLASITRHPCHRSALPTYISRAYSTTILSLLNFGASV